MRLGFVNAFFLWEWESRGMVGFVCHFHCCSWCVLFVRGCVCVLGVVKSMVWICGFSVLYVFGLGVDCCDMVVLVGVCGVS